MCPNVYPAKHLHQQNPNLQRKNKEVKAVEISMDKRSIFEMCHGAFMELADYSMAKLFDDIMDPNT